MNMPKLSEHFDQYEFTCKCGCNKTVVKKSLIDRLEKLRNVMNASKIIVNSGYRCPKHSVAVGGYINDAHTQGFAVDCTVYDKNGKPYSVETVAYYADKLGFGGIGLMNGNSIHLDTRDVENYANSYWHGDERTGKNFVAEELKHDEIVRNDNEKHFTIRFDDKVYSGILKGE